MITGLNSAGVDVADLRVLPAAVSRHLMKTHGYEAGIPRRRQPERPRDDQDPVLRAARDPDDLRAGEGGREALQPPRAQTRALRRHRPGDLPGPRARELRAGSPLRARRRRDPRARLPARRRLRLLGELLRPPAAARAARDRSGDRSRVHDRPGRHRGVAARVDRPYEAARLGDRGGPRGGLRPGGRAAVPRRRTGPRAAGREDAAPVPAPARCGGEARHGRRAGHGHEPRRGARRRGGPRGPADARGPGRADARGLRGRRRLRGRDRGCLRLPGVPARPTTRSRASASCWSCSRRSTGRSRSSPPTCRAPPSCTASLPARGR